MTARVPGGQLYMEYKSDSFGERHTLRLHTSWFDPSPIGDTHDRLYIPGGPVTPSEASILATFTNFAAVWQPFYSADWELSCVALLKYNDGNETVQIPTPNFPSFLGTDTTDLTGMLFFNRKFSLLGQGGAKREFVLAQVPGITLRSLPFFVNTSVGGIDARDRAMLAYLSGASGGGFVMPDGTYCFGDTQMVVWWARVPELRPSGTLVPGSPYVVTG